MLGRDPARCRPVSWADLRAGRRPHCPCAPAAPSPRGGGRDAPGNRAPRPLRRIPASSQGGGRGDGAVLKKPSSQVSDSPKTSARVRRSAPQFPESRRSETRRRWRRRAAQPGPRGRSALTSAQRSCMSSSVPAEGTRGSGPLSRVRSRQRRGLCPSGRALLVRTQILSAAVRGPPWLLRPSGTQKARTPNRPPSSRGPVAPEVSSGPTCERGGGAGRSGPVSGRGARGGCPAASRAAAATRGPRRAANLAVTLTARAEPARGPARRGAHPRRRRGRASERAGWDGEKRARALRRRPNGTGEGGGGRATPLPHSSPSLPVASPQASRSQSCRRSRVVCQSRSDPGEFISI